MHIVHVLRRVGDRFALSVVAEHAREAGDGRVTVLLVQEAARSPESVREGLPPSVLESVEIVPLPVGVTTEENLGVVRMLLGADRVVSW